MAQWRDGGERALVPSEEIAHAAKRRLRLGEAEPPLTVRRTAGQIARRTLQPIAVGVPRMDEATRPEPHRVAVPPRSPSDEPERDEIAIGRAQ